MSESQEITSKIRMLPHDDEAERGVLGALLLNSEVWDTVSSSLEASDFYSPFNSNIFQAISDIMEREGLKSFDGLILVDYLKRKNLLDKCGGVGYIAQLTNIQVVTSNISRYVEIVQDASKRRRLFSVSTSLEKDVFDPSVNIDDSLDQSSKILTDALLKGIKEKSFEYSLGRISQFTFEEITKKLEGTAEIDRIETGFDVLDKYTNGGFAKEEYIIIGARPSIGKTAFALSMMYNMMRNNKKIAFFSLEMPAKSIAMRLFAIDSKVELAKIIKAQFIGDEFERIMDSCGRLYDYSDNMYIVDVPNISLTELRAKARILKKEKNIDCIVIDYIGLISVPSSYASQKKFEQVSMI